MKVCPNAECKYAIRFKRPAEYQDFATTCSDCGAALTPFNPSGVEGPAKGVASSDVAVRLLVTVASALSVFALSRAPLFGMRQSVAGPSEDLSGLRLLQVGMAPFISGFLLVEIVALLLPPLRARRVGSAAERAPLNTIALILGSGMLVLQLINIVRYTEATHGGLPPPAVLWTQLLLAHALMLGLTVAISRWGLGNGFAVVIAATTINQILIAVDELARASASPETPLGARLLPVLLLLAAVGVVIRFARAARKFGEGKPSAVPFPVSGLSAWSTAGALMSLPATLAIWLGDEVQRVLQSSWSLYTAVMAFLAVDVALLLGFLFFRPRTVGQLWARWNPGIDETGVVVAARALLPKALALAVAATVGVPLLLAALAYQQGSIPVGGALALVLVVALVIVDLADEWTFRQRHGSVVNVRPVQRTAEVEPIVFALREKGIEAYAQSFCFRVTEQFFAPYAPVGILVPASKEADARAVVDGR